MYWIIIVQPVPGVTATLLMAATVMKCAWKQMTVVRIYISWTTVRLVSIQIMFH